MKFFQILILVTFVHSFVFAADNQRHSSPNPQAAVCNAALETVRSYPREIDPAKTFESLVQWVHDELILKRGAPSLVVGISGTDSVVAFLACAKAYEKAGKGEQVAGVHFSPSDDFLDDHPEASAHLWFQEEVIPWLKKQAPLAKLVVDSSIDFRRDGLRWGALMEWSVTDYPSSLKMRAPEDRYWVVGTRNATEEALGTYSNASAIVSVQPITHLWKSEILRISEYLGVPQIAADKSCEVDCACGRLRLPAHHIPEVDAILMVRQGVLSEDYIARNMRPELRKALTSYIDSQIQSALFKKQIPYTAESSIVQEVQNPVLARIEAYGTSFASWRFLTQSYEGKPSLAEQFGMRKLIRQNDIRDPSLDVSNPNRDELGRGYVWQNQDWYIEYRRAYTVVSKLRGDHPATLIMRNNSKYFGHDRLKNAVYFSVIAKNPQELESITPEMLEDPAKYSALHGLPAPRHFSILKELLDYLDHFNERKDQWINSNPEALAFLASRLNK